MAAPSESAMASLGVNRPATSPPRAMMHAPLRVAMSTIACMRDMRGRVAGQWGELGLNMPATQCDNASAEGGDVHAACGVGGWRWYGPLR